MTHSQNYSVTKPEKAPQQPHLKNAEPKSITCLGWCGFATAGILALTTLLCITLLGGDKLFPRRVSLYEGLIPLIKTGYLDASPFSPGISTGIKKIYSVQLPPKNLTNTTKHMEDILNGYPVSASHRYRHCWLQNPSSEKPCYFNPAWITEFCSSDNNFGYSETNGTFSPCFLLKIVESEEWSPILEKKEELPAFLQENYDPGFIPVDCKMYINRSLVTDGIQIYPPKGFSHLYFPISTFNVEYYLHPLVAVKARNIRKGENATVECTIIAINSLNLFDNGAFSIRFSTTV